MLRSKRAAQNALFNGYRKFYPTRRKLPKEQPRKPRRPTLKVKFGRRKNIEKMIRVRVSHTLSDVGVIGSFSREQYKRVSSSPSHSLLAGVPQTGRSSDGHSSEFVVTHVSRDWSVVNSPLRSRHCQLPRTCPERFFGVRRSLWEIKVVTRRGAGVEGCFHPTHSSGLRGPAKRIRHSWLCVTMRGHTYDVCLAPATHIYIV